MYNMGFAIFAAGSVLLFLIPNSGTTGGIELVFFRIVQGVGGAFLLANSAALLTDAFPHDERGKALGINQVAAIGGSVVGLVLGGILAGLGDTHIGGLTVPAWRIIFLVSVPFSLFGTAWAYLKLHNIQAPTRGQSVDWVGNILFGTGLTLLLVAVTYGLLPYGGQLMGWSNPWVGGGIVAGIGMLLLFLWVETRVKDPMFRLHLFRIRAFAAGNFAGLLGSIARGGVMFMLIIWFQGIWLPLHGYSFDQTPFWAGIYMLPMLGGFVVFGPLSGWLSDRFGARYLASLGMAIGSVTFFLFLTLAYDFPYWQMGLLLFIQGSGMGMFAAPNTAAIMNAVPAEHRGAASGMRATLQNAGMQVSMVIFFTIVITGLSTGLTGAVDSALLSANVSPSVATGLAHAVGSNPTGALFGAFLGVNPMTQLPQSIQSVLPPVVFTREWFPHAIAPAFMQGLDLSFLIAGSFTAVAAVVSLLRGERYVHDEQAHVRATKSAENSGTDPAAPDRSEVTTGTFPGTGAKK
jgi:MFS family permease